MVMEDFPTQSISLSYTDGYQSNRTSNDTLCKLAVQFIVRVDPPVPSCMEGLYLPMFLSPTPAQGALLYASADQPLEITVRAQATNSTVSELLVSGPSSITENTIVPGEYILRWTPTEDEEGGYYPVCFIALGVKDSSLYHSELRCVIVSVGKTSAIITTAEPTTSPPLTINLPTTEEPTTSPPLTINLTATEEPTTSPPLTINLTTTEEPTTSPPLTINLTTTEEPTTSPHLTINLTTTEEPTTSPPLTINLTTTEEPTTSPPLTINLTTTEEPTTSPPLTINLTTTEEPTTSSPLTNLTTTQIAPAPPTTTQTTTELTTTPTNVNTYGPTTTTAPTTTTILSTNPTTDLTTHIVDSTTKSSGPRYVVVLRIKLSSLIQLTDDYIRNEVLQQLREELIRGGLPGDFTLRLRATHEIS
ncbi:platelet glycoprotein Ib alpha chain-like [Salvelinus alpinus]|uniref:platelet glycoprotein Ib alpha chain-like n=1 Tax=Salvelinus alpinus TaxID=8036 RepID=UPI0039FC02BF